MVATPPGVFRVAEAVVRINTARLCLPYRDFMLSPRVPWSRFLIVSNGFFDVARDTEKDGAVHRRRSSSAPPSVRCCLARILVRTTPAVHSPAPLPVSTGDPVAQELQPWHDEFRTEPPATEDTLREMQLRNISLNERIAWTASTTFAVQFFLRISSQPKNPALHVTWKTFVAVCCERLGMLWSTYILVCFGRLYTTSGDQFAAVVSGLTGGTPITPSDIEALLNAGGIGPVQRLHIYDRRRRYFTVYEQGQRTLAYSAQTIPAGMFGNPTGLVLQYGHRQQTFTRFPVRQWTRLRLLHAGKKLRQTRV